MRRTLATLFAAITTSLALAAPASPQAVIIAPGGLIDVNVVLNDVVIDVIDDVNLAVAAQLCDTNVNVLAVQIRQGQTSCDMDVTQNQ